MSQNTRTLLGESILIVDDTPANLDLLTQVLEPRGCRVLAAPNGDTAVLIAGRAHPTLILLDVMMPGIDGYEVCRRLKADPQTADIPVIFISARDETQSIVEGFGVGGVDYIAKPFQPEEVLARVQTHVRMRQLARELQASNAELTENNGRLRAEIEKREKAEDALVVADQKLNTFTESETQRWGVDGFVGQSKTIQTILKDIRRLQNFASVNALITGESGTGKELVARAIHFGSTRSAGPFIPVNCVAIPTELAESMFFGHIRGAFTGAMIDRKGFFELAHGGTLFLDEIGDMPVGLQAKLLRVLEDGRVTPLGASRDKQVDVRIVAATNADVQKQIAAGAFREDLYFRLAQFTVEVPPLRNRRDDIPLLATHFNRLFAREMGIPAPKLEAETLNVLGGYSFPGNIRELKNIIERALIESGGESIGPEHLRLSPTRAIAVPVTTKPVDDAAARTLTDTLPLNLEAAENMLIKRALAETNGNIAEAARRLGVNRTRIYRKLGEGIGNGMVIEENRGNEE